MQVSFGHALWGGVDAVQLLRTLAGLAILHNYMLFNTLSTTERGSSTIGLVL